MDETEVGAYFDTASSAYTHDQEIDEIDFWPIVDGFIAEHCSPDDRVLEIGCGDGLFLEYVLERTDVDEAYGIDISREMLPGPEEDVRARYLEASATDLPLPFEPESFDYVVFSDVLHHLVADHRAGSKRKAQVALVEAVNLLRDGGHLIVKDIYHHSPVGPDELTSYQIFYGLKYLTGLASVVDDQATDGLLVSFYTEDELVEMLEQAGTTVVRKEVERMPDASLLRRVLIGESACIRLYAEKNRREPITDGW
ncbi:class I SAM-dependent methyltransferase [Natrialbaceae archaeon A-gly3]